MRVRLGFWPIRPLRPQHACKPGLLLLCAAAATTQMAAGCKGTASSFGDAGQLAKAQSTADAAQLDPGVTVLHRLNRAEYNNSVRDLLRTQQRPADQFVADGIAGGFDNSADALVINSTLLRQYFDAATALAQEAADPNSDGFAQVAACDLAAGGTHIDACLSADLAALARRAWRRPVQSEEVAALLAAAQSGQSATDRLQLGVAAILVSPHFVFRVELDDSPLSTAPHPLTAYELATRLAYFLWSSTPDDALLAAADAGTLTDPNVLSQQVDRMLADNKAQALVQNFGGQWLAQRDAAASQPDPTVYQDFSPEIRSAMLEETGLYLNDFILGTQPISTMLTSPYTYANDALATFYGLKPPGTQKLVKVPLGTSTKRGGLLTQGTVLMAGAHPTTTSPVLRGRFVLQQLLCTNFAAPPAGVSTALPPLAANATLRQELEQHVLKPECAFCHNSLDPIGFALEAFSGIGQLRTTDNGQPVDTTGTMISGDAFVDALSMQQLVARDARLEPCAEKMMLTYALGRPLDALVAADVAVLASLDASMAAGHHSFVDLIHLIVASPAFTQRRGRGT